MQDVPKVVPVVNFPVIHSGVGSSLRVSVSQLPAMGKSEQLHGRARLECHLQPTREHARLFPHSISRGHLRHGSLPLSRRVDMNGSRCVCFTIEI
jgi:hypothetical protein